MIAEQIDISWIKDGAYCRYKMFDMPCKIHIDKDSLEVVFNGEEIDICIVNHGIDLHHSIYSLGEFFELCEKWTPQLGELCWFWDSTPARGKLVPYLAPFRSMYGEHYSSTYSTTDFENCIPYLGERFWENEND